MQITLVRRSSVIAILALSVACCGTGCKSSSWSMPGASWLSWNKKKPASTSSIAGTRSMPQPPSLTTPPYQIPGNSASPASYGQTASTTPRSNPQGAPSASPSAPGNYYTGPYNTGAAGTQRGFYSPQLSQQNGTPGGTPRTADRRNSTYNSAASYPATPSYSAPPASTSQGQPAPSSRFGPMHSSGAATAPPSYTPPTSSYPATPPSSSYSPSASGGSYPSPPTSSYPSRMPTRTASAAGSYNTSPAGWQSPTASTGTSAQPVQPAYSSIEPYTPGSTGRNDSLLGKSPSPSSYSGTEQPASTGAASENSAGSSRYPATGSGLGYPTHTANPSGSSSYPPTYSR